MRISAISQHRAECMAPDGSCHIISIRSPGNPHAMLPGGFGRVTYVAMSDSTFPEPDAIEKIAKAARVAKAEGARRLVVQCEMGVSRSVGSARAIAIAFNLVFDHEFPGSDAVRRAVLRELL